MKTSKGGRQVCDNKHQVVTTLRACWDLFETTQVIRVETSVDNPDVIDENDGDGSDINDNVEDGCLPGVGAGEGG